ncbi:MAG: terminase TerL endonuclease subunit, partial [Shewanella sp.]
YDPYHMREVALDLEEEGIPMIAVSQGAGNMSEPAKKLEGLIAERLFRYNGSVLFQYATSCALTGISKMNNMMVFRDNGKSKTDKIDPLIATIIALSGATLQKPDSFIYNDRGMVFL